MIGRRAIRRLAAGLALAALATGPAAACRLALVLALDVSSSVDAEEDSLQRRGLAAALVSPVVVRAFLQSPRPVALAVFEWSGRYNQKLLLDWTMIRSPEILRRAASALAASTRSTNEFPTALGHALGYGATLLSRAPACDARTIDLSGDGRNNEGFKPAQAYASFPFAGVVVNALAIRTSGVKAPETSVPTDIAAYYAREVLFGPGAFLEIAQGYTDFERAMRRKLERELRPVAIGALEERP